MTSTIRPGDQWTHPTLGTLTVNEVDDEHVHAESDIGPIMLDVVDMLKTCTVLVATTATVDDK